jgi:hypothetical protein
MISRSPTPLSFFEAFPTTELKLPSRGRGVPPNRTLTQETFPKSLSSPLFTHCHSFRVSSLLTFPLPVIRYRVTSPAAYILTSSHSLLAKAVLLISDPLPPLLLDDIAKST